MKKSKLITGNCIEVLRGFQENSVDSIVTDPPYGLEFMGKDWDAPWKEGPEDLGHLVPERNGVAKTLERGVAFQAWCESWLQEALRVLKPGGYLLAFGGTRTYHRLACAAENVGFEIRDSLHWIYGSGFPKSMNVGNGRGTALKPAHEPIVMARKPLVGKVVANVEQFGTGTLNIDASRIPTTDKLGGGRLSGATDMTSTCGGPEWDRPWMHDAAKRDEYARKTAEKVAKAEELGRWPSNILLSHSEDCTDAECSRECAIAELEQHNEGASRFFYVAKPSKKEKGDGNTHPTVKPIMLMRYLCRLVTTSEGIVLDPFLGSGTTGIAALIEGFSFVGIERESQYMAIATKRIEEAKSVVHR